MINWTQCDAVERDIEKVGGAWVFRGARVPFYSEGAKADIEHRYLGSPPPSVRELRERLVLEREKSAEYDHSRHVRILKEEKRVNERLLRLK